MSRLVTAAFLSLTLCLTGCPDEVEVEPSPSSSAVEAAKTVPPKPAGPKTADQKSPKTANTENPEARVEEEETTQGPADPTDLGDFLLNCGCQVEGVMQCGDYAFDEGKWNWVPLTSHDLGYLPFHGKNGLEAGITGVEKDGGIAVHSFSWPGGEEWGWPRRKAPNEAGEPR